MQPVDKRFTYEKLIHLNYFNDIIWDRLHDRDPPFVPSLSSPEDTSYFSTFEIQRPTPKVEDFKVRFLILAISYAYYLSWKKKKIARLSLILSASISFLFVCNFFFFFFKLQRRFTGRNLPFLGFTYLWNELTNTTSETNYFFPSFFATPSVAVGDRRRTDHFNVR